MDTWGGQFATALNIVESRLNDKIGAESAVRSEENKAMKTALDQMAQRVEKLERAEHAPAADLPAAAPRRADGWAQNSIILGGFNDAWNDTQRVTYIENVMGRAQIDSEQHLVPLAPPRSSIVKVRCATTHAAAHILFQLMRGLEKFNKENEETKKAWAALERPPEEGHRRRALRRAAEDIKAMLEPGDTALPVVHWAAGEIWLKDRVLLRAVNGRLCAAESWGASPPTRGKEWTPRPLTRS